MARAKQIEIRLNPLLEKLKRGPQAMLPKDIGIILAFTGVGKESVVLDAGTGSGFLAISLANICKKVVTYEWREEWADLARKNIARSGFSNVELKNKDVFQGIEERELDAVCLDLAETEKAVPHATAALKKGGFIVSFNPHAEQVTAFAKAVRATGEFEEPFTFECAVREMLVREAGFRPETKGLTHTGYLSFARKKSGGVEG